MQNLNQTVQPVAPVSGSPISETVQVGHMTFLGVEEFKTLVGCGGQTGRVLINPNTGKWFYALGDKKFKCQKNISNTQRIAFIVSPTNQAGVAYTSTSEMLLAATLSNVKEGIEAQFSL